MNSFLHAKKICGIFLFALLMIVFKNAAAQVPVITMNPPTVVSACAGAIATITIAASNNPTSYLWQYYNSSSSLWVNITDNAVYSNSNTATLSINTSSVSPGSTAYQCYAQNASGYSAVSDFCDLEVSNSLPPNPSFLDGNNHGLWTEPITSLCTGTAQTILYGTSIVPNCTYAFNYTGTGTTLYYGNFDTIVIVVFGTNATSGVLSVKLMNGCGVSNPTSININIDPMQNTLAGTSGGAPACNIIYLNGGNSTGDFYNSCMPINSVTPSGSNPPTFGEITSCVTIDPSVQTYNGNAYVQRHYNIDLTDNSNPLTATATVTLYFTQQDFDNFNAARGSLPALPTGPTDAAGISNIRVTQFHGAGTTPGTYVGSAGEINPDDNNIIWNASASRWEITFNITGFSGFFLSTASLTPLPLTLIDFKGTSASDGNLLQWITASEINVSHFEIERSEDGINYKSIGTINAIDNSSLTNNYSFKDALTGGSKQVYYYRLNMVDMDGKSSYSKIVVLQPYEKNLSVKISPNPFKQQITASIIAPENDIAFITITDVGGKKVMQQNIVLNKGLNTLQLNTVNELLKGIYFLRFSTTHDTQTIKLIKEE